MTTYIPWFLLSLRILQNLVALTALVVHTIYLLFFEAYKDSYDSIGNPITASKRLPLEASFATFALIYVVVILAIMSLVFQSFFYRHKSPCLPLHADLGWTSGLAVAWWVATAFSARDGAGFTSCSTSIFIGCRTEDVNDRKLAFHILDIDYEKPVESCRSKCLLDGYIYAGLQADLCFCGFTYRDIPSYLDNDTNISAFVFTGTCHLLCAEPCDDIVAMSVFYTDEDLAEHAGSSCNFGNAEEIVLLVGCVLWLLIITILLFEACVRGWRGCYRLKDESKERVIRGADAISHDMEEISAIGDDQDDDDVSRRASACRRPSFSALANASSTILPHPPQQIAPLGYAYSPYATAAAYPDAPYNVMASLPAPRPPPVMLLQSPVLNISPPPYERHDHSHNRQHASSSLAPLPEPSAPPANLYVFSEAGGSKVSLTPFVEVVAPEPTAPEWNPNLEVGEEEGKGQ
ncbi:hypothetical protein BC936DRAFT_141145 [Jimgerdemannia flammicorona]|uniref:WSC domain-containing protein n=1 Tax=Jimgerdemannia flammicorona TaxID=994334 RepID=A0A433A2S7_9FUNG|nr:hypothetical protein BC936DRAFT_141145 [Jimgerdemannia flammicorona]